MKQAESVKAAIDAFALAKMPPWWYEGLADVPEQAEVYAEMSQ